MKFLAWLRKNSDIIKALASLIFIFGALTGIPTLLYKWMKPDIVITFSVQNSTMPPALKKWIEETAENIKRLPPLETRDWFIESKDPGLFALLQKLETDPYRSFRDLQKTGPLESEQRNYSGKALEPGSVTINIVNQTDRVIPNVRLRLDQVYPTWGVYLEAKFLTENEISNWQKSFSLVKSGPTVVFPDLPPLPPNSSINIIIYGSVDSFLVYLLPFPELVIK